MMTLKMNTLQRSLFITGLFFCLGGFAQVGINTTTPNAQLDVRSSNQASPSSTDGILIPKIDAFPAVNPGAAQQGMLVYLTTVSYLKPPGFYYWDNATTSWIGIAGKVGWEITGNTGASPLTHFIGTKDNQGLAFRTNDIERMRIGNTGNLGIGTAAPQSKLHVSTGASGMTPNPASVTTLEAPMYSYLSVLSGGETGVLFGANGNSTNGAIVYNNSGLAEGMLFRTAGNVNRMVIGPTGNIGFGNFVPQFPLHFDGTLGDKISLWGNTWNHYGFGIQHDLLQIHTNGDGADVAFGWGSSSAFTETMRIKGTGRLGLGTNAPEAKMEIKASNAAAPANTDGILIPRVGAFPAVNPTAAQNGMMVYLTAAASGKLPGFYYWDNASTSWKGVGTNQNWGMTGNSGTSSASNFIGTTDNQDLVFKRNNIRAGLLGASNTAFGSGSMGSVTSGISNVAIGVNSLALNMAGNHNVALGTNALYNNTASEIVGIGENALAENTTGEFNTAVGTNSSRTNLTGNHITSMGYNSLFHNKASFNTAYGVNALLSNQTGEWNTAFGINALKLNTTGHHNTALGDGAMVESISAEQNTAVGHYSMAKLQSGGYNVAVGMNAFHNNLNGLSNTAIGTGALYWHASGNNNTAIGMEAMNNQTAGNNNIAIGKGANVPSLTGSNQLSIGNVIYGTGMDVATSAKIGIGTASPQTKLHVYKGASGMTPNPFSAATLEGADSSYLSLLSAEETGIIFGANGNSTNGAIVYNNPSLPDGMIFRTNGNTSQMILGPTGNLALGGFIPTFPLHFNTVLGDKIALWGTGANHYGFGIQSNVLQIHADFSYSDVAFGYGSSGAFTETMRVKGTGRLGLGTSTPEAKIEIKASNTAAPANTDGILIPRVSAFPAVNPTAAQNGMMIFLTNALGAYASGFYYWDNASVSWLPVGGKTGWNTTGNSGTSPAGNFIGTNDNAALAIRTNGSERVRVSATGDVGIGTTAPTAELEVNGFTKLGSSTAPAIKMVKLTGNTASLQGGNVSIAHGVANPSKILSVSIHVEYTAGGIVPSDYNINPGYEFTYYISAGNIIVFNKTANSSSILNKPMRILVTYEE